MIRPTYIRQPGPPLEPRIVAVACRARRIALTLRRGRLLLDELAAGLAAQGVSSGVAHLPRLDLSPFAYVMPALSRDGANAAYYSDTFRPSGVTSIERGAITIGTRDGAPFFHAHALWREADGQRTGGHILPSETFLAEDAAIDVVALDGCAFDARPDAETNFTLMAPVAVPPAGIGERRAVALRLKPNQDFAAALVAAARDHGFRSAGIAGGVGSLIGAAFEGRPPVENFATEVFLSGAAVSDDGRGGMSVEAEAALVDYTGALSAGSVAPGINPVLMTFELVLVEAA